MTKEAGFTLVEVLVAILVFSFTMFLGLTIFRYRHKHIIRSREVKFGLGLAGDRTETLKTDEYDQVPPLDQHLQTTHSRYGTIFTCDYWANEIITSTERYKVVSVTVTWISAGTTLDKEINVRTIFSP